LAVTMGGGPLVGDGAGLRGVFQTGAPGPGANGKKDCQGQKLGLKEVFVCGTNKTNRSFAVPKYRIGRQTWGAGTKMQPPQRGNLKSGGKKQKMDE